MAGGGGGGEWEGVGRGAQIIFYTQRMSKELHHLFTLSTTAYLSSRQHGSSTCTKQNNLKLKYILPGAGITALFNNSQTRLNQRLCSSLPSIILTLSGIYRSSLHRVRITRLLVVIDRIISSLFV